MGVVTRPASVAKARALGVALEEASRDETDKTDKTDRPRTAVSATRRIPSASGDEADTTEPLPRGASRPATTRAGLRAEALAEAELQAERENEKKKYVTSRGDETERSVSRDGKDSSLSVVGWSPAIAAGTGRRRGGAAGEAAAAAHLAASPCPARTRRRRRRRDGGAGARGAPARAEQAEEARRERGARASARGRSVGTSMRRLRRASAGKRPPPRLRRRRARARSARARRVGRGYGLGGSPSRIASVASRPETAYAFVHRPRPVSGREAAMAAAGRSRAHSARPSHPQYAQRGGERLQTDSPYGREPASARRDAEAREAAAAVAALPEHFSERFSIEKTPVAAAGRFPERRPIQQKEPAPVRPLWPSRPSTAEAACVGRVPGVGGSGSRGEHLGAGGRPSSAAALRRAAALCAEIENTRASEKQKRLTVTRHRSRLSASFRAREKSLGRVRRRVAVRARPMFGDETFAAVPEKGARKRKSAFRSRRETHRRPRATRPGRRVIF